MNRALYRVAAVITALFTAGHSAGTYSAPSAAQRPAALVMEQVRFDLFGAERTYWQLFHAYGVLIIFTGAFLAVLLWMLSRMPPQQARPIALLTAALQAVFAFIAFTSFFWAPAAFNAASAACAAVAALKE